MPPHPLLSPFLLAPHALPPPPRAQGYVGHASALHQQGLRWAFEHGRYEAHEASAREGLHRRLLEHEPEYDAHSEFENERALVAALRAAGNLGGVGALEAEAGPEAEAEEAAKKEEERRHLRTMCVLTAHRSAGVVKSAADALRRHPHAARAEGALLDVLDRSGHEAEAAWQRAVAGAASGLGGAGGPRRGTG